ncbi:MAG TPA: PAS domain-containing sensor histidine kinase, partial [Chroococcales cyanobacterium]
DNALDVICSIDANSRFVEVNPASFTVLGYPPEDLMGKRYLDIVVPEDIEEVRKTFEEIVTRPRDLPIDIRILRRDGKIADLLWSVHWSQKDRAWFCVAHDVTEQRKVEQMKQDFMAMVGHDLRTPLNSVAGTLHMLIEGMYDIKTDAGMSRVKAAESNVWRLVELVNDLLDIEKLAAGHLVMEPQPVSLAKIVQQACDTVANVSERAEIKLECADAQTLNHEILADEDRLVQVVVNLLSNAIKFSPPGSTIKISAADRGASWEVRVTDSGRGIPKELHDTIFDRFKQVETADGRRHKGTGLGLAICKEIVLLHGGAIGVESEPGEGSTFWFRIRKA